MPQFTQTHAIPRDLLNKYFGGDPRLVVAFENLALAAMEAGQTGVAATDAIDQASVLTLSPNAAFSNEYVLQDGNGTKVTATPGAVQIDVGTLNAPTVANLVNAATDAAAASGGVPVGGIYHNAGALRVRLV